MIVFDDVGGIDSNITLWFINDFKNFIS